MNDLVVTKELTDEAEKLMKEIEETEIPPLPKVIVGNVTPEALTSRLAEHGGRLLYLTPEAGGDFFEMMGRYSRTGKANLDVYLKAHTGETLRDDRKGVPDVQVENPALTTCLSVQPPVLRQISSKSPFRQRGLMGRFLFTLPDCKIGYRPSRNPPVPAQVKTAYEYKMKQLYRYCPKETITLVLSREAADRLCSFGEDIETRQRPGCDLHHMHDWAGKLEGNVARLAGILHLAEAIPEGDPSPTISLETMERAISLGEYYLAHAKIAYLEMGNDPAVEEAQSILDWLIRSDTVVFKKRDVQQHLRNYTAEDIQHALDILETNNWVRRQQPDRGQGKGRPPDALYQVNPKAKAVYGRPR